jgi:hypothetical protein
VAGVTVALRKDEQSAEACLVVGLVAATAR